MTSRTPTRSPWRGTAIWLAVLLSLELAVSGVYLIVIPGQKRVFDEYNLQLPWLTKTVLDAGNFFARYSLLLVPTLLSATLVGVILGRHLFRRPTAGTVVAVLLLMLLLLTAAVTVYGLNLPYQKMTEGLSK
jgi:type II secretory pathway component PulF